ncbi:hypothetical protein B296_00000208, partial [Ensete ventricosum]
MLTAWCRVDLVSGGADDPTDGEGAETPLCGLFATAHELRSGVRHLVDNTTTDLSGDCRCYYQKSNTDMYSLKTQWASTINDTVRVGYLLRAMEEGGGYPRPIGPGVTRVGWIGAGVMGAAMAARLRAAGYDVAVYARTPSKADHLRRLGAHLVPSPADAARSADVLFTMVGHPSDV